MKICFAAVVLCLMPTIAFCAAPKVVVVDAQGKVVGPIISDETVLINVGSLTFVSVFTDRTGFVPSPPTYYFTSSDCTGTKYLKSGFPQGGYVAGNNNNLLVYGVESEQTSIAASSTFVSTGSAGGGECRALYPPYAIPVAAPAKVFSLTSLHLTPPFKITVQ